MPLNSYLPWNIDQPMLLPVDMRAWLRPDHDVYLVLSVLDQLDLSAFFQDEPWGTAGRPGYHPKMMLSLLVYGYLTGVRSSRQIERACEDSVAFRVLAGGCRPDHSTIARFRDDHLEALKGLFVQVLRLVWAAGLGDFSILAADGSKFEANAGNKAQRTLAAIEAEIAEISGIVETMLAEAVAADTQPALPSLLGEPVLKGRRGAAAADRLARLRSARDRLRREDAERAATAGASKPELAQARVDQVAQKIQRRRDKESAAAAAGRRLPGSTPDLAGELAQAQAALHDAMAQGATPPDEKPTGKKAGKKRRSRDNDPDHKPTANVTDPDSKMMRHPHRGWHPSYNAQATTTKDNIVILTSTSHDTTDYAAAKPTMAAAEKVATEVFDTTIGTILFDAGYFSEENVTAAGPDRIISDANPRKLRHQPPATPDHLPDDATPLQRMRHRRRTAEGAALYKHRQHLIEPVFGDHKYNRNFWKFQLRGEDKVDAEWSLMNTVRNLRAVFRHGDLAAAGLLI